MIEIATIETSTLGDRSYLVHDGEVAFVVDPQRDIDRVLALAAAKGVRISHVLETHIHNDYVSGGLALARETGAVYLVNDADEVGFERAPVHDREVVPVGRTMTVLAMATPGHTFTHLSYVLLEGTEPVAVFTGGSLLYGSTGRPDLLGAEHTTALVHAQYGSVQRLVNALPDSTPVYPTHGFGSFCASSQSQAEFSTIGRERQVNPALTQDEETYVESLLAGLDVFPAYYAHMAPVNAAGPAPADLSAPRLADPDELRRRIDAGEWVVDLRYRTAFAAGHLPGALNFGLDDNMATYVGWLVPWGTPVTLLGQTVEQVMAAQRELVRIGIDRPAAAATGHPEDWAAGHRLASYPTATFAELAGQLHRPEVVVLDVRRPLEWAEGHVRGAVHIPLHELASRLAEVPPGEVWVHCHSGYRSSIAASLLARSGRSVVSVSDEIANTEPAGVPLTRPAAPATTSA